MTARSRAPKTQERSDKDAPMRIAKAIARAGLCSRREAERWIVEGRVAVNGELLTTPAHLVAPGDDVRVDGEPLPNAGPPRLWRYHKPKGQVTSTHDPEGRKTVFDALPNDLPRVMKVGRLDFTTEGLLLLTNHGGLARHLELPATGWLRRYRVRAHGKIDQAGLDRLKGGITIDGVTYGSIEAKLDRAERTNQWFTIALREGKNREIKRVLGHLGLEVNRLIRISYGPFALGELKAGAIEEIRRSVLTDQLGASLSAEFGLKPAKRQGRPAP